MFTLMAPSLNSGRGQPPSPAACFHSLLAALKMSPPLSLLLALAGPIYPRSRRRRSIGTHHTGNVTVRGSVATTCFSLCRCRCSRDWPSWGRLLSFIYQDFASSLSVPLSRCSPLASGQLNRAVSVVFIWLSSRQSRSPDFIFTETEPLGFDGQLFFPGQPNTSQFPSVLCRVRVCSLR
jgi:hypothetical protein